jgi:uncharacterized protein DUF4252
MCKRAVVLCLVGPALLLQACLTARSLEPVRRDLQSQMEGARFDKEIKLTLGPVSLGLARLICRLVPDEEVQQTRRALASVHRIELAVYDIHAEHGAAEALQMPHKLRQMTSGGQWQTAVRVQDEDERVWILYREDRGRIRDFYVVTLGSDELVLVRVKGNMNRLVEWAMREHGDTLFGDHGEREVAHKASPVAVPMLAER